MHMPQHHFKCLIVGDPARNIQPEFDSSIRLAAEFLRRGWQVDYCDLSTADLELSPREYLSRLPAQRILEVNPNSTNFLRLDFSRPEPVTEYAVILQRKDPPVDESYRAHSRMFTAAPKSILQINNPNQTWRYSEHALPADYPKYGVPTYVCQTFDTFLKTVRRQDGECVVKPYDECSGNGIEFFQSDISEEKLREYWETRQPAVIVQPYLEEITRSGDLRILVMNGKVLGSVMRVPRQGSRLANLHQGATGRAHTPSAIQLEACQVVGRDMAQKGLYLLGLDFIGDQLSEVNITCPSAMAQINKVMHKRIEIEVVNEIEALRYRRRFI